MSLVGTRPPTVDEWEQYELHHRSRMSTKPGITGIKKGKNITDFEHWKKFKANFKAAFTSICAKEPLKPVVMVIDIMEEQTIAELLAATGYIDKETVEMGLDAILNFEFHGQKIGVWLEDYAENPYGQGGEDDYEQRDDIIDGLSGDREAVILYGLGFPEFDDALDYSTIKWNNNGLRTNKNDACTVDNFKTDLIRYMEVDTKEEAPASYPSLTGDIRWE